MEILECPVLTPSEAQFLDFFSFAQRVQEEYAGKWGLVRVRPPAGFRARSEDYVGSLSSLQLPGPIQQNTFGKGGVYQCTHIQRKGLSLTDYIRKVQAGEPEPQLQSKIEDTFWANLGYSPPLYGADVQLSLMDTTSTWNLNSLRSLLSDGLKTPLGGINTPYCYFGSWKSFFCWHTQDLQLSGINYLHYGRPKHWYAVPAFQRQQFQKQLRGLFPECYTRCAEYSRHKTLIVNPKMLKSRNPALQIAKTVQSENQFIIVFGGAFHCGFNSGFNVAEAVNFATPSWLSRLPAARSCKCQSDSVTIDKIQLGKQLVMAGLGEQEGVKSFIDNVGKQLGRRKRIQKQADSRAQCARCKTWRRLERGRPTSKGQSFLCQDLNLDCKELLQPQQ